MKKYRIERCLLAALAFLLTAPQLSAEPSQPDSDSPQEERPHGKRPHRRPPGLPPHGGRRRPPEHGPDRRFRSGPGMWQVFSQLSPEERQAMLKLQREDPEKFREVMSAKADELYRKRKERRAALHKLAEECRNATDPEKKEQLKQQLAAELEKDFRAHLEANRRQIEDMKRRTARLEAELQRREKNVKEAVSAWVEAMLKGELPPPPPDSRRIDRKPLEK